MDASKPILFYDIASRPPATCYAPNPWKTRYALNFKGAHYKTEWVELPDVTSTGKKLGAPPTRKHWDGSDFYTMPVIHDLSTGKIVADTFDIARYLDKTYPDAPALFPGPSSISLTAAFNKQIDALFTQHVILCCHGIPFNPDSLEEVKASFLWRAQKERWEDLTVEGEARTRTLESLKAALGDLAKIYSYVEGPFLEGGSASYADLIVGAWLQFYRITLPKEEWEDMRTWHDGMWGKLHLALEKYAEVK